MPFSIQYDPITGEILAAVEGAGIPVMKDTTTRKQCIFDLPVLIEGKSVNVNNVVESKVYQSSTEAGTVLKAS